MPDATRDTLRDMAVRQVDDEHGYTAEFATDPSHHRYLYDVREKHLREAVAERERVLRERIEALYAERDKARRLRRGDTRAVDQADVLAVFDAVDSSAPRSEEP